MLEAAREELGGLDLLVNNAGVSAIGPFVEAGQERLRKVMEVNFFAPAELMRDAMELLRRGRQPMIVNISSVLGHRAVPSKREYCASKFALHGLSDAVRAFSLAAEAPYQPGVRIMNAAAPKAWVVDPVADILRNWWGDDVDVSHFEQPGHEYDSVYGVRRIKEELGFVAEKLVSG